MKQPMSAKGGRKFLFALLIILLGVFLVLSFRKKTALLENNNGQQSPVLLAAAINGTMVSPEIAARRPIAVMVENHPDARPQSGLFEADVVYEALTEGGITRFMAIYQTKAAKSIGPVRSARTYFAEIANELKAVYAHVGGNSDALASIKNGNYKNISNADQFFDDPYFQRITLRPMPHNVYTSVEKLEKLIADKKFYNQADYQSWQFKDDSALAESTVGKNTEASDSATKINIDFSTPEFAVMWKYDLSNNSYLRYLAKVAHKDLDTKAQIAAKNIIVQFVNSHLTKTDTIGSIDLSLVGLGQAKFFFDGKEIDGIWVKTGNDRTRYFDSTNNEIKFNRGQTWVELVPVEKEKQLNWD